MKELLALIAFVLGVLFSVIGGTLALANALAKNECNNYQEVTGKKTKYMRFDSCYVETKEGFQRWDEYKARAVASEGLKEVGK